MCPSEDLIGTRKAKQSGFESRFIDLAGHINAGMPRYVVERVADALNSRSRAINASRVHLFGMAYKPNVSDIRESPSIDIALLLRRRSQYRAFADLELAVAENQPEWLESSTL